MNKRIKKRERMNYAPEFETMEELDKAVTLDEATTEFLLAKQAERSSDRTIRDYKTHFRYFQTWLEMSHHSLRLVDITTKIILEYISYMSNEKQHYDDHPTRSRRSKPGTIGLSPMTVNVRIRTLRSFFNWCYRNGKIRTNVVQDVKLQKVDQDTIIAFTSAQVKQLLLHP